MSAVVTSPQRINLYNPALLPARQQFPARSLAAWVGIAALAMGAIAWWSTTEMRALRQEMAGQARPAVAAAHDAGPTQQQVAALEQALRDKRAHLAARQGVLDTLMRGVAGRGGGPSGVMRRIAETIPPSAWLTEVRVAGSRIDVNGKALDPAAVDGWVGRLRASGFLAQQPQPSLRLERIEPPAPRPAPGPPAYLFQVSAALSSPFAEEARR